MSKELKSIRRIFPKTDLAWASVYLAQAFEAIGEYEKANAILERSLKVHNEFLGESNIRSAWVLFHLGSVTIKRRFFQPAKNLLQKALIAYEKDYGKDHIETARIYRSLGQVELVNGNLKKAEECFYRALKIFQVKDHADRYIILEGLAQIHHDKSKRAKDQENISDFESSKKQAKAFLHQAMEVIKAYFPDDSPHIKRIQKKLYNFEVKS